MRGWRPPGFRSIWTEISESMRMLSTMVCVGGRVEVEVEVCCVELAS